MPQAARRMSTQPSFAMAPVHDLRTGLPAAYTVSLPRGEPATAVAAASQAARSLGFEGPLQLVAPISIIEMAAVDLWVGDLMRIIGLSPTRVDVVLSENAIIAPGYADALHTLESVRALGCGVVLELQDDVGFPMSDRGRAALSEVRVHADDIGVRSATLFAAREAGITLTAVEVLDISDAHLVRMGFDRRA